MILINLLRLLRETCETLNLILLRYETQTRPIHYKEIGIIRKAMRKMPNCGKFMKKKATTTYWESGIHQSNQYVTTNWEASLKIIIIITFRNQQN